MLKRFILTFISAALIAGFALASAVEAHPNDRRVVGGGRHPRLRTR